MNYQVISTQAINTGNYEETGGFRRFVVQVGRDLSEKLAEEFTKNKVGFLESGNIIKQVLSIYFAAPPQTNGGRNISEDLIRRHLETKKELLYYASLNFLSCASSRFEPAVKAYWQQCLDLRDKDYKMEQEERECREVLVTLLSGKDEKQRITILRQTQLDVMKELLKKTKHFFSHMAIDKSNFDFSLKEIERKLDDSCVNILCIDVETLEAPQLGRLILAIAKGVFLRVIFIEKDWLIPAVVGAGVRNYIVLCPSTQNRYFDAKGSMRSQDERFGVSTGTLYKTSSAVGQLTRELNDIVVSSSEQQHLISHKSARPVKTASGTALSSAAADVTVRKESFETVNTDGEDVIMSGTMQASDQQALLEDPASNLFSDQNATSRLSISDKIQNDVESGLSNRGDWQAQLRGWCRRPRPKCERKCVIENAFCHLVTSDIGGVRDILGQLPGAQFFDGRKADEVERLKELVSNSNGEFDDGGSLDGDHMDIDEDVNVDHCFDDVGNATLSDSVTPVTAGGIKRHPADSSTCQAYENSEEYATSTAILVLFDSGYFAEPKDRELILEKVIENQLHFVIVEASVDPDLMAVTVAISDSGTQLSSAATGADPYDSIATCLPLILHSRLGPSDIDNCVKRMARSKTPAEQRKQKVVFQSLQALLGPPNSKLVEGLQHISILLESECDDVAAFRLWNSLSGRNADAAAETHDSSVSTGNKKKRLCGAQKNDKGANAHFICPALAGICDKLEIQNKILLAARSSPSFKASDGYRLGLMLATVCSMETADLLSFSDFCDLSATFRLFPQKQRMAVWLSYLSEKYQEASHGILNRMESHPMTNLIDRRRSLGGLTTHSSALISVSDIQAEAMFKNMGNTHANDIFDALQTDLDILLKRRGAMAMKRDILPSYIGAGAFDDHRREELLLRTARDRGDLDWEAFAEKWLDQPDLSSKSLLKLMLVSPHRLKLLLCCTAQAIVRLADSDLRLQGSSPVDAERSLKKFESRDDWLMSGGPQMSSSSTNFFEKSPANLCRSDVRDEFASVEQVLVRKILLLLKHDMENVHDLFVGKNSVVQNEGARNRWVAARWLLWLNLPDAAQQEFIQRCGDLVFVFLFPSIWTPLSVKAIEFNHRLARYECV